MVYFIFVVLAAFTLATGVLALPGDFKALASRATPPIGIDPPNGSYYECSGCTCTRGAGGQISVTSTGVGVCVAGVGWNPGSAR